MRVTVIPVEVGALGMVPHKGLKEELETIQTTELLRSVRILRRVQKT